MFKDRLTQLRMEMGYSQDVLAKKLGITQPTVWHWENGRREPSVEMLLKIADFFNVSVDFLVGRSEDRLHIKEWQKDGETFGIEYRDTENDPTPQEREAVENAEVYESTIDEVLKFGVPEEYIRRIVREELNRNNKG